MAERLGQGRKRSAIVTDRGRLFTADLPSTFTSFVGREVEAATVAALVTDTSTRVVTLVGPGGVGKTRLAVRVAAEVADTFPDGVAFVSLGATRSPDLVADRVCHALGIVSHADRTPTEHLLATLRDRRTLLVLDGYEHLLAAAGLVSAIVDGCPRVSCLVTSRRRLRLVAEHVHHVGPLRLPEAHVAEDGALDSEAVRLFLERADEASGGFVPSPSEVVLIGRICRRLDGLPLAIELAAARVRLLSVADIWSLLERHVPVLGDGPDDIPDRLRTMHASVAWSYDLLPEDAQRLLRRLAVFDGSLSLAGAEAMARGIEATTSVLELLEHLLESSLLGRAPTAGATRYAMLETVREVMLDRLRGAGEEGVARTLHADHCLSLAEAGEVGVRRAEDQRHWLVELEYDHANMRAAILWYLAAGRADDAARVGFLLMRFWVLAGHVREADVLYQVILEAEGLSDAYRVDALASRAVVAWSLGDVSAAIATYQHIPELADGAIPPASNAYAAWAGVIVMGTSGDLPTARLLAARARTMWAGLGHVWYEAASDWALGMVELVNGDAAAAEPLYRRALLTVEAARDELGIAIVRMELGSVVVHGGDPVVGLLEIQHGLADSLAYRAWMHIPVALEFVGLAHLRLGDVTRAARFLGASDRLRDRLGFTRPPGLARIMESVRRAARAELGAPAADAAIRGGRELSEEDAIAEALVPIDPSSQPRTTPTRRLSPRELEVLALVADGRSDQQIAERLFISTKTASKHVAAAIEKLGAQNRTGAAAIGIRHGLI